MVGHMPLAKRIIPCLDVDAGRVVKGVQFVAIRDAGDPVEIARRYDIEGADELTFLDITASHEQRDTMVHVVDQVAGEVFIPLTVGGGIREPADIRRMLNAGADKVAINTAAVFNPGFVREAADKFGSQCIVVAIDAKQVEEGAASAKPRWEIFTHGGRKATGIDAIDWAKKMAAYGAGDCIRGGRKSGTSGGRDSGRRGRCSTGGQYFSLWRIQYCRGQTLYGRAWYRSAPVDEYSRVQKAAFARLFSP